MPNTYQPKVYKDTNGDRLVVESGGVILVKAGGKVGFGGTAAVMPIASASQAVATQTETALTDSTGGAPSTTLAAITAGASYAQADMVAAKNAIASLAAEIALVKADNLLNMTLTNAIRTALISLGFIKGSA